MMRRADVSALFAALRPLALFAAAALAVLTVSRLGLVLWQLDRVTAADMLAPVFLEGLRFDVVLLSTLLLPPVVALPLFGTSETLLRIGRPVLLVYLLACFAGI